MARPPSAGSVSQSKQLQDLWFGSGCLNANQSTCYPPTNPYYTDTTTGLYNLVRAAAAAARFPPFAFSRSSHCPILPSLGLQVNQYRQSALALIADAFQNQAGLAMQCSTVLLS